MHKSRWSNAAGTVLALDAGNQVSRFGRQAEIKFQVATEGLKKMGYRAIGLGPDDLRLSAGELVAVTATDGDQHEPVRLRQRGGHRPALMPRFLVLEAGGQEDRRDRGRWAPIA